MSSPVAGPPTSPPSRSPAELDRRFHASAVDRAVSWGLGGVVAVGLAGSALAERPAAAVLAGIVVAALAALAMAVAVGLTGRSPGLALRRLRVEAVGSGAPCGIRAGLRRGVVLGIGGVPTLGVGAAVLAWSAATDPARRRQGWHDRWTGSLVVDARPMPAVAAAVDEPPHPETVNLTAMRLVPAPSPPAHDPVRAAPASPAPAPTRPTRSTGSWRVLADTGESVAVDGLVLVGRGPEARPGETAAALLTLASGDLSLSKTHAQIQVARDGTLVAADRGSTNGSVLVRQGVPRALAPGRAVTLVVGDRVRLGDRELCVVRDG